MLNRYEAGRIDTTVKIWDYFYKARIPTLASRSIEDIRQKGTIISGVPEIDKDIKNQWTTLYLSIAQMVEYYQERIPVKVVDIKDTKLIYEAISHHIHAWKQRLEHGINIGDAPIEDLIAMDAFANLVYAHAKYQFTAEIANSIMAQHLSSIQRLNSTNFFGPGLQQLIGNSVTGDNVINEEGIVRINSEGSEKKDERDSYADFFKSRLLGLKRY